MAERARRDRGRSHRHARSRGPFPDRDLGSDPDARSRLASAPHPRARPRRRLRCDIGLRGARRDGAEFAKAFVTPYRCGSFESGLSLRHLAGDRPRLCAGAREPHHLCRRARLRALRADGVRPERVRHDRGGRQAGGPSTLRLPCHEFAADGEGLPSLGARHLGAGHAAGSGPRLCRRLVEARRVPRPRRASAAKGKGREPSPRAFRA